MTNTYRWDTKEGIILLLIGLLCPAVAVFFLIISIYKRNLFSVYILAFLTALLIGIMPPYADNYSYYQVYRSSVDFNISNWFYTQKDFLFNFLAYIFNFLNLQYITFRLFLILLELFIFAWIFVDFTKININYLEKNKFLYFLIICFLSIDIIFICFMIRYALMATFLILGVYLFYKSKYIMGFVSIFLAIISHFGAFLFLPVILLSFLFRYKISYLNKFLISLLCFLVGLSIFSFIYYLLPDILKADTYITGTWSGFEVKSFNGMMFYILQYYIISGILMLCFLFTKTENNYLSRFAFFSVLLFCCICSFSELSQRVWWIAKIILVFSLLLAIVKNQYKKTIIIKLYFIIALLLASQMMSLYGFREPFFDKDNFKHTINLSSFILSEPYDDAYFFRRSIK